MKLLNRSTVSVIVVIAAVALTRVTMIFAQGRPAAEKPIPTPIKTTTPTRDAGDGADNLPREIPSAPRGQVTPESATETVPVTVSPGGPAAFGAFGNAVPSSAMTMVFPPSAMPSPEDREFEMKSHELVAKLKEMTDEAQKKATVEELTTLTTKHFNVRQKQRDQELQQLEEQLKKLRAIQEKREAARAEIVAERVRQLVRESEGLNWGGNQVGPLYPRGASFEPANPGGNRSPFSSASAMMKAPVVVPPPNDEIRVFKITEVENGDKDSNQVVYIIETIESLLGKGPQRPKVTIVEFENKIVARGNADGLRLVETIISKLQEDMKDGKQSLDRDDVKSDPKAKR